MRALILLALAGCTPPADEPTAEPIAAYDPLPLVDPFVGSGGLGAQIANVNPGASRPFGMVLAGPDTRNSSWGAPGFYHTAGYHYVDDLIDGFAHTHAHGIGINDYGGVHVMARADWQNAYVVGSGRAAPFDHADEQASPGYYEVLLQDDGTRVRIAATERGAVHRYTFADTAGPVVLFDLGYTLGEMSVEDASIDIDVEGGTVRGQQNLHGGYSSRFGGLRTWFTATVDPAPAAAGVWTNSAPPTEGLHAASAREAGGWLVFPEGTEEVVLRVAVSYTGPAGADANHAAEVAGATLDEVRAGAEEAWREQLSGVRVRGGTEAQRRTFHTALYHAALMPSLFHDVDGSYRGLDGEVHTADFAYYTDLSLWDTFRTLHPWYTLAWPDRQLDMLRSLVRMTEDGGSVPRWPMAHGYTGGMVGSPTDQVFAGSYLKGLDEGWGVDVAFEASYAKATGPVAHASRGGIEAYRDLGYVSYEASTRPASKTLEYAWSDDALARWAEALGRADAAGELAEQAGHWRHTWDPEAGWFRGRYEDGSFDAWEAGDEFRWADDYVEGNAWHYRWYVPFDVPGMIDLQHDGDVGAFLDLYADYWDEVAAEEDDDLPDDWYWHGNEPVLHYAWLGSLAGAPDLTAEATDLVRSQRYDDTPEGLDGNDDSGTLSAWYLFAAAGLYPVAGTPDYAVGSPLFERLEIDRPEGTLVVRSPGEGIYVQAATLGEQPLSRAVIDHHDLVGAGELVLERGPEPGGWVVE